MSANGHPSEDQPVPVYPAVTIYAVRDASGRLEPIAASLGGISLPVVEGSINMDPNGLGGTRAITATLRFPIGGGGICEVESPEDVPDMAVFTADEA